jgi:hypothetical protein
VVSEWCQKFYLVTNDKYAEYCLVLPQLASALASTRDIRYSRSKEMPAVEHIAVGLNGLEVQS